jgi:hypothetical protein
MTTYDVRRWIPLALLTGAVLGCGGPFSGGPPGPSPWGPYQPLPTYRISGTVSGEVSAGVTITAITPGDYLTATTDASGHYQLDGAYGATYTVSAESDGFAFQPGQLTVVVNGGDVTGQDFTAPVGHSVSGTVTGAAVAQVVVRVSTPQLSATAFTDTSGSYTIHGLPDGIYQVAAVLSGYRLLPNARMVTVAGQDAAGQDFTSSAVHGISGSVSGLAPAGVTVTLSGAAAATTTTHYDGSYTFDDLDDGDYTLTASLAGGYAFSPASLAVTVSGASVTGQSFTEVGADAISGTLRCDLSQGGTGVVPGAEVSLSSESWPSGLPEDTVLLAQTDASGQYAFTGLPDGTYTVSEGNSFTTVTLVGSSARVDLGPDRTAGACQ